MRIIGCDPGISGALCLIEEGAGRRIEHFEFFDMPTIGETPNHEIDALLLYQWIKEAQADRAILENVRPMPSIPGKDGKRRDMGATSAFNFGGTVKSIRACFVIARVPIVLVTPAKWKKHFGLKGSDKEPSRQRALELFPLTAEQLKRKMDHPRAEALLIARYGGLLAKIEAGGEPEPAMEPPVGKPGMDDIEVPD